MPQWPYMAKVDNLKSLMVTSDESQEAFSFNIDVLKFQGREAL